MARGVEVLVLLAAASNLPAGSVLMKNGYIVQGPIAERTPEAVVVEWKNGRVTIPRRFITNVVLDPAEEKRLQAKRAPRPSDASMSEAVVETELVLPSDPGDLFPGRKAAGPDSLESAGTAHVVLPGVDLGERQQIESRLTGSIPAGWTLRTEGSAWLIEGPAAASTDRRPRIVGSLFAKELSRGAQIDLAREEAEKGFSGWQMIEEGRREIGLREGYEIMGKGQYDGTEYHVRQILVWVEEGAVLMSCVCPSESDAARQIEWCLQTFEFTTQSR